MDSNNSTPHSSIVHCRRLRYKNFNSFSSFQELKKNETSEIIKVFVASLLKMHPPLTHVHIDTLSHLSLDIWYALLLNLPISSDNMHIPCNLCSTMIFLEEKLVPSPIFCCLVTIHRSHVQSVMHGVYERRSVKKKMKI